MTTSSIDDISIKLLDEDVFIKSLDEDVFIKSLDEDQKNVSSVLRLTELTFVNSTKIFGKGHVDENNKPIGHWTYYKYNGEISHHYYY